MPHVVPLLDQVRIGSVLIGDLEICERFSALAPTDSYDVASHLCAPKPEFLPRIVSNGLWSIHLSTGSGKVCRALSTSNGSCTAFWGEPCATGDRL